MITKLPMFEKIYEVVSRIPKGKVTTYKKVAAVTGIQNPRLVGVVLHRNIDPQHVPCHRVVRNNGTIATGYAFGGTKKQREKLKSEGVHFLPNDRVDLTKCLYQVI